MPTTNLKIQFLRGNTQDSDTYQGREGELTVDTQKKRVRLHDGTTTGGVELAATSDLNGKVDKVSGKGLSTNDYTTTEKNKLSGIQAGAQVNSVTSVAGRTGVVTLGSNDIPNLPASKITTGIVADARLPSNARGSRTVSTGNPSGGSNGDIWLKY